MAALQLEEALARQRVGEQPRRAEQAILAAACEPDARRARRALGPALDHLPHLALVDLGRELGGLRARVPRARSAGIADLRKQRAVAEERREQDDARELAGMLSLIEQD